MAKGKPRWKCRNCHYQYTRLTPRGPSLEQQAQVVKLYCSGVSLNQSGKLLDWEVGKRDAKTLERLYRRIGQRFKPNVYCVDDYLAYQQVIPEEKLVVGKAGTSTVENNNSNTQHWFKRFTRRSKVVSKAQYMAELTLKRQAFLKFIWSHR